MIYRRDGKMQHFRNESWLSRAIRYTKDKNRVQPKDMALELGCHHLKANNLLQQLGWYRSLEEIKEKHSWRVFYYRGDQ